MKKCRCGKILYGGTSLLACLLMVMLPAVKVDSKDIDLGTEQTMINNEADEMQDINQGSKLVNVDAVKDVDEESTAVKVIDNQTTAQPKLERSLQKSNDDEPRTLWVRKETGEKLALRYPSVAKPVEYIPDWSLKSLLKLANYQLLQPNDIFEMLNEPDREFMGKMISRAYNVNEAEKGENYKAAAKELGKLMNEYDTELRNLGYFADDYARYGKPEFSLATKIGGELRYHYVNHDSNDPRKPSDTNYNFHDRRLRLRLFVEQPINEDWSLHGMGEAEKSWVKDSIDDVSLARLYLSGKYKEINIKAGRFGKMYADGNVYDGNFDGLSLITGEKTKFKLEKGELRDGEKGATFIVSHSVPSFDFEAGVYSYDDVKTYGKTTISSLGSMYYTGDYGLGAMWLHSNRESVAGGKDGYVLTLKYGRNRSWRAGTYEVFAKYYDQPDSTYIAHTMVGLADYMQGFKGYGVGTYYTLAENTICGIEYYDLENKLDKRRARTLWAHVSFFF